MIISLAAPMELLRPQMALACGALAVLAAGASRRVSPLLVQGLAGAAVVLALFLALAAPEAASIPLLRLDLLGWAVQPVFLLAALGLLHALAAGRDAEVAPALVLGSLIGMGLVAVSGNLLMLFIGLELMSVPSYLLVARSRGRNAPEAAVKYFFAGSAAGALFIMGMALRLAAAGSLSLAPAPGLLGEAGLALMLAAALFKLGAVPLHFWLPDVYEAADAELAAFFSTGMKAAATLLLARLAALSPHGTAAACLPGLGALTVLFGAFVALRQTDMQRLLAYSSIAHAGHMILAVSAWAAQDQSARSAFAVVFYLCAYLFMSGGSFLWLRSAGIAQRSGLKGLAKVRPAEAAALAVLLLALAGIPPTAGFAAKFLVYWELFKAGLYIPLVLAGLGSLISLGYYLGLIRDMYFESGEGAPAPAGPGFPVVAGCAAASVLLGLTPWLVGMIFTGARP